MARSVHRLIPVQEIEKRRRLCRERSEGGWVGITPFSCAPRDYLMISCLDIGCHLHGGRGITVKAKIYPNELHGAMSWWRWRWVGQNGLWGRQRRSVGFRSDRLFTRIGECPMSTRRVGRVKWTLWQVEKNNAYQVRKVNCKKRRVHNEHRKAEWGIMVSMEDIDDRKIVIAVNITGTGGLYSRLS